MYEYRATYWSLGSLSGAISFEEKWNYLSQLPSITNIYSASSDPLWPPFPFILGICLYWSCIVLIHTVTITVSSWVLLCLENYFIGVFTTSGSYYLSSSLSTTIFELSVEEYNADKTFRAEHSAGMYSLCMWPVMVFYVITVFC